MLGPTLKEFATFPVKTEGWQTWFFSEQDWVMLAVLAWRITTEQLASTPHLAVDGETTKLILPCGRYLRWNWENGGCVRVLWIDLNGSNCFEGFEFETMVDVEGRQAIGLKCGLVLADLTNRFAVFLQNEKAGHKSLL